jgi:hypothetical protein
MAGNVVPLGFPSASVRATLKEFGARPSEMVGASVHLAYSSSSQQWILQRIPIYHRTDISKFAMRYI